MDSASASDFLNPKHMATRPEVLSQAVSRSCRCWCLRVVVPCNPR